MVNRLVLWDKIGTPEDGADRARIKAMIRAGYVVSTPRQCGATQALLELIHEDHDGKAVLIAASGREAHIYEGRYMSMYPNRTRPTFRAGSGRTVLDGIELVYVDGLSRFDLEFLDVLYETPVVVKGLA